jgi:transcriptional/translational regulatory protein YebC/TACO1
MFQRKAHFVVNGENADEAKLMDIVLDAGAEDIEAEDGIAEIWGPPENFAAIAKALEDAKIDTSESAIVRKPENLVGINDLSIAQQAMRLVDKLEDLEDVQNVYSNMDIASEVLDKLAESEG